MHKKSPREDNNSAGFDQVQIDRSFADKIVSKDTGSISNNNVLLLI